MACDGAKPHPFFPYLLLLGGDPVVTQAQEPEVGRNRWSHVFGPQDAQKSSETLHFKGLNLLCLSRQFPSSLLKTQMNK